MLLMIPYSHYETQVSLTIKEIEVRKQMTVALNARAYALDPDAGTPMTWFSSRITLKASSPELGVTEATMSPGEEPPFHVHKNEDEWFFVTQGEVSFHVGDEV